MALSFCYISLVGFRHLACTILVRVMWRYHIPSPSHHHVCVCVHHNVLPSIPLGRFSKPWARFGAFADIPARWFAALGWGPTRITPDGYFTCNPCACQFPCYPHPHFTPTTFQPRTPPPDGARGVGRAPLHLPHTPHAVAFGSFVALYQRLPWFGTVTFWDILAFRTERFGVVVVAGVGGGAGARRSLTPTQRSG